MNHKAFKKFVFLIAAGSVSLMLLFIGSYQLYVYTDSTAFCGVLCHEVMNPEYTTYQASPHSRVLCSSCHVGPGASYLVKSKIQGIPQLFAVIFNTYPKPITSPVANLRPAADTCEQCHRPELFTGDLVTNKVKFDTDAANSRIDNTLVMRVGGGEPQVAGGIHWHIAANVWYLPMDEARQQIGWVGVETTEGKLNEFINQAYSDKVTQGLINKEKRLMDCVDCHNRATHIFQSPEQLVDAALQEGRIDISLPFLKKEALNRLSPLSPTVAEANARVDTIRAFYKTQYPQVYATQETSIDNLIIVMKEIVALTVFPDMKVNYQTHINNLGHLDSPGCFRCHQELVSKTAANVEVAAECNTCHYTQTILPPAQPPAIPHTLTGRGDCLSCHGPTGTLAVPASHAGRVNSTCTTCHITVVSEPVAQAPAIPHTLTGRGDCLSCHGPTGTPAVPLNHTGWTNSTCATCHEAVVVPETAVDIPHTLTGLSDCITCHSTPGVKPIPASHTGRDNGTCTNCHAAGTVTVTVTGAAIPHTSTGDCAACHGLNANWPSPANHNGRPNTVCILCHESLPVAAPNINHNTQNANNCLSCHSGDGIVPYPPGHTGWTNNTCSLCHQTVPVPSTNIPHSISSITECASCHGTRTNVAYPANHINWTSETCTLCHRLAPIRAAAIPHTLSGRTNCLSCHGSGEEESLPRSHVGWTVASCTLCHIRR